MFVSRKTGKRGRPLTMFACSTRRSRGPEACSNLHGVPAGALTEAVTERLKRVFLDPAMLGSALMKELERRAAAPDAVKAQRTDLAARVAKLAGEIDRLTDAIAEGAGESKAVVTKLREKEADHRDATAQLEHLNGLAIEAGDFDVAEWLSDVKDVVANLKASLELDVAAGRQSLKKLLTSPIVVTPTTDADGELAWEFKLTASFMGAALDVAPTAGNDEPAAPDIRLRDQSFTGTVTRRALSKCPRGGLKAPTASRSPRS